MSAREKLADICDAEIQSDNPSCYVLADAILAAMPEIVGAMVKPLVWISFKNRHFSLENPYISIKRTKRGFKFILRGSDGVKRCLGLYTTLEAAKAAAEAHHRAAVLASIGYGEGK